MRAPLTRPQADRLVGTLAGTMSSYEGSREDARAKIRGKARIRRRLALRLRRHARKMWRGGRRWTLSLTEETRIERSDFPLARSRANGSRVRAESPGADVRDRQAR